MQFTIKVQRPKNCKCGRSLRSARSEKCDMVVTYPEKEISNFKAITDKVTFEPQVQRKDECTPPSTFRKSFSPYHPPILAYPTYKRPAGCDVLASYNRVCEDMDNTLCLGFINSKDNEIIWGEFKKQIPLPKGRITQLPDKRRIHFNHYYIRNCTPETAESWKMLAPESTIS